MYYIFGTIKFMRATSFRGGMTTEATAKSEQNHQKIELGGGILVNFDAKSRFSDFNIVNVDVF